MRRHCSGSVILFSMQDENEFIDRWVRRGGKAVVLERSARGEMMVIREGRRSMPDRLGAHAARDVRGPGPHDGGERDGGGRRPRTPAGAHLHDIRQGLRSFTTSIYQAPGRLNVFDLDGVKVILDYAHNAAGLETLGDFVERLVADVPKSGRPGEASWSANLRVAVVATAGDRRDEDMKELGRVAAKYFDEVIVREDVNSRGRERGETAKLIVDGVREQMGQHGARAGNVDVVLDEMDAVRRALDRSRPGDLVVLCVDYATEVFQELEQRRGVASPMILRASEDGSSAAGGDPDFVR